MCGAIYNASDHPALPGLLSAAGYTRAEIDAVLGTVVYTKRELRPTDRVLSLVPTKAGKRVMSAVWWLKLDNETLKPDTQWASFNCQSRRILTSKMHSIPPRSYRAVVFARGFFEWQSIYPGGRLFTALTPDEQKKPPRPIAKHRYLIHDPGKIMMLAAMCKHWVGPDGEAMVSTGVITLPPHPDFLDIHYKSFPLVLQPDELAGWLDKSRPHKSFEPLFNLTDYRHSLEAVPVNEPAFEPIGDPIPLVPGAKASNG
ncbi:SOS response-associated peptidase family protein [Saccharospirillum sp.]|uniref:SOS response-associated peptidase family protein n=1 Tax=Saccharospirillum sp. TaxID=2033801 RepID=UPI0034A09785